MKDKFLVAMNEMLNRWKDVKEKRFIVSGYVNFLPRLIRITLKHTDYVIITALDGGLTSSLKNCLHRDASVRVTVAAGDLSGKGYGLGIDFNRAYAPRENIDALKRLIDSLANKTYQEALDEYFDHHRVVSKYEPEGVFEKLSREEPVDYREAEKKFDFDWNKLSIWIEEASKLLQGVKEIESTQTDSEFWRENRRLVSFERLPDKELKSSIFTSEVRGHLKFTAKIRDADGRLINYREKLAGVGLEKFTRANIFSTVKRLIEKIKVMKRAKVEESDFYRAVLDAEFLYVLFHEGGVAHDFSAEYIDRGEAPVFKGKTNKKILPSFITIYDDSTLPNGFGSFRFDEEGTPAQRTLLVENGILRAFLHDRVTAGRRRIKSNGKSRSAGTRKPEPRVSNFVINASKSYSTEQLIQKMIRDLKKEGRPYGLYIKGGGGDVNPDTGEFRMHPEQAYRIYADGTREPISSFTIFLEPYQALNSCLALGNEREISYGFCGAESGLVSVQADSVPGYLQSIEVHTLGGRVPRKRFLKKLVEEDDYYDDEDDD